MINLYITRHGETEWNTQRRLQGWRNSPLTKKGNAQGNLLRDAVKKYNITKIYTSTSERALKTAMAARGKTTIPVELMDELREMNMGDWEGRTIDEIKEREPENFSNYWNAPHLFVKNTGEDFDEILDRSKKAIEKILEEEKEGNILIVTHGVTLKALMSHFSDEGFSHFWTKPVVMQASISLIEVEDIGQGEIKLYGDVSHFGLTEKGEN